MRITDEMVDAAIATYCAYSDRPRLEAWRAALEAAVNIRPRWSDSLYANGKTPDQKAIDDARRAILKPVETD